MDRYVSLKSFLQESLTNYKTYNKMGFAILHAIIAVELALKERLFIINPHLIYEDIDSNKKKTITLSKLPHRLKNLGISLNTEDKQLITVIAEWRNDLVHNIPSHNNKEAKAKIGKLYNFIFSFLARELNKDIRDILSANEISSMKDIADEAAKLISDAKQKAAKNLGRDYPHPCNDCHELFVVGEDKNHTIFCFLCEEPKQESQCTTCEKSLYLYSNFNSEEFYCNECMEDAYDNYISMQIDLSRGK